MSLFATRRLGMSVLKFATPPEFKGFAAGQADNRPQDVSDLLCNIEVKCMIQTSFVDPRNLRYAKLGLGTPRYKHERILVQYVNYVLMLAGSRSWSLYPVPPLCYAAILSQSQEKAQVAMDLMRNDWQNWNKVEAAQLTDVHVQKLILIVYWMNFKAIRLMFMLFERYNWDVRAQEPVEFYRALLDGIPDERVVEEIHKSMRDQERNSRNEFTSIVTRQQTAIHCGVLEGRDVFHPKLTKEEFVGGEYIDSAGVVKIGEFRKRSDPDSHKLPKAWAGLMGTKTWANPNPINMRDSLATWGWVRQYFSERHYCHINAAWATRLLTEFTIVEFNDKLRILTAPPSKYGIMSLVVTVEVDDNIDNKRLLRVTGQVEMFSMYRPRNCIVIPHRNLAPDDVSESYAGHQDKGILVEQTGGGMGLIEHALTTKVYTLSFDELTMLANDVMVN